MPADDFAHAVSVYVPSAPKGWALLMQHGVVIPCRVGIPVKELMLNELSLPVDMVERRIDVVFLDGMPLDSLDTPVPDGARLAFAAGLPGIAGLAMKKDSAIKALRPGITHTGSGPLSPAQGRITLALFSLALPMQAEHILSREVYVTAGAMGQFLTLVHDCACTVDGLPVEALAPYMAKLPPVSLVRLRLEFVL